MILGVCEINLFEVYGSRFSLKLPERIATSLDIETSIMEIEEYSAFQIFHK